MKKVIIHKSNLVVSSSGELLATNDNKKYFNVDGFCFTSFNSGIDAYQQAKDGMVLFEKKTGEDNTEEPNHPYEIDFNDLFNNCMSVGVYTLILITVFILALVNN